MKVKKIESYLFNGNTLVYSIEHNNVNEIKEIINVNSGVFTYLVFYVNGEVKRIFNPSIVTYESSEKNYTPPKF